MEDTEETEPNDKPRPSLYPMSPQRNVFNIEAILPGPLEYNPGSLTFPFNM